MKIGTWNVRPRALKIILDQQKIYVSRTHLTCLKEIRWNGTGVIENKEYTIFIASTIKITNWELTLLLVKEFRTLMYFEGRTLRLCWLRIKGRFFNCSIINVHIPTEDK